MAHLPVSTCVWSRDREMRKVSAATIADPDSNQNLLQINAFLRRPFSFVLLSLCLLFLYTPHSRLPLIPRHPHRREFPSSDSLYIPFACTACPLHSPLEERLYMSCIHFTVHTCITDTHHCIYIFIHLHTYYTCTYHHHHHHHMHLIMIFVYNFIHLHTPHICTYLAIYYYLNQSLAVEALLACL